ncbi:hypothetical protein [Candidatus Vampirococcus lugosii]|uniref:Transcription factor E (TFE) n=1 Tax=Candidatus Vampirococcus lugosii TaxID=2789015 RepID=A0ABS5QM87_9BACT|nr:hypothetical protein [Candidatus Vampirococcus lugosii]MBS8122189.1 Transcription factor E (TFE) [Candidatus Vampirococcus lugosii]
MKKLKQELLKDKNTLEFLKQIAGPLATDIVKMFEKQSLTPEQVSDKLNEKITVVRSTLNSLHYRGIACYKKERRKDNNLYEFYWEIKYKKIIEILLIQEMKKFKKLEYTIEDKQIHDFFYCPKKCIELPFEEAAGYNFKCPNCNSNLEMVDTKKKITTLKRKKTNIQKNINRLEEILNKINDDTKGYICE